MKKIFLVVLVMSLFTLTFLSANALGCSNGCTPGYWKQAQHFDSWCDGSDVYVPGDDFETVFGVDASFERTLLEALKQGGGGEDALARHAVAALLNGCSEALDFYDSDDIIHRVQDAYKSGDFESLKNSLDDLNNLGCPLN